MAIAKNEVLENLQHAANLPSDIDSLYTLSRLPAPELEQHIKAGSVHAGMYTMVYIPARARVGLPLLLSFCDNSFSLLAPPRKANRQHPRRSVGGLGNLGARVVFGFWGVVIL